MKWNSDSLLNNNRRRQSRSDNYAKDGRNVFENDYGRIILSSAFRRLQDKAQVFPLDTSDFIRTRLTHSIEVAAISSSMGTSIEKFLIENGHMNQCHAGEIKAILSSVGLLHDIGNTPFGHFGEYAIQQYFRDFFSSEKNEQIVKEMTEIERSDLENFDGNAHILRLITKLQYVQDIYGLNLTYGTLSALVKYPCNSAEGNVKDKGVCYKKFGYFQSENNTFFDIANNTGLIKDNKVMRHPLVFIMEAADDIAFSVTDLEDGIKKKVISINDIKEALNDSLTCHKDGSNRAITQQEQIILSKLNNKIDDDYPDNDERIIQIVRAKIQGYMIEAVVEEFVKSYNDIINGNYNKELLNESKAGRIRSALKEISYAIFNNKVIITKELAGENVITSLLNMFVKALTKVSDNKLAYTIANTKENRLYRIISSNYRYIYEKHSKKSVYDRLLLVTDFICGMTDYYAIDLYKKLSGY